MASKEDTAKTPRTYAFPEYGVAVEAENLEEATKLAEKKVKENK